MKKKILSGLLAAVMVISLCAPTAFAAAGMSNFKPDKIYANNFKDVAAKDWYHENVKSAYEYGFMVGIGNGTFGPNANLKIIEAVVMADRIYSVYNYGSCDIPLGDEVWYSEYVDFAVKNRIIREGDFENYDAYATRAETAYIFGNALPSREFETLNSVTELPDVARGSKYADDILNFVRSGISIGIDRYGTFGPGELVSRAQAAAFSTRLAVKSLRLTFIQYKTMSAADGLITFDVPTRFVKYTYNQYPGMEFIQDPSTNTIVSVDTSALDVPGFQIDNLFTADAIKELYIKNLTNESSGTTVTSCTSQKVAFGVIHAYKSNIVTKNSGTTFYHTAYIFISGSNVYEFSVSGDTSGAMMNTIAGSVKVGGFAAKAI